MPNLWKLSTMLGSAICCALLVSAVALGSGASRAKERCLVAGKTVSANGSARLYKTPAGHNWELWICSLKTGRRHGLGSSSSFYGGVRGVMLAGPYVGTNVLSCDQDSCLSYIAVTDARNGRTTITTRRLDGGVSHMIVTPRGAVAWSFNVNDGERFEVWKRSSGEEVLLASGKAIDPGSIAANSGTIYWTDAGVAKDAAF